MKTVFAELSKQFQYEGEFSLFDVPLHYNFFAASKDENYDLTKILDGTLLKENPSKAVTLTSQHLFRNNILHFLCYHLHKKTPHTPFYIILIKIKILTIKI